MSDKEWVKIGNSGILNRLFHLRKNIEFVPSGDDLQEIKRGYFVAANKRYDRPKKGVGGTFPKDPRRRALSPTPSGLVSKLETQRGTKGNWESCLRKTSHKKHKKKV